MKIEDPFLYIEKLIERGDGPSDQILAAKNKLIRGDLEGALSILRGLPPTVLALGNVVADPAKRNATIPDVSKLPDFLAKKPAKVEAAKGLK